MQVTGLYEPPWTVLDAGELQLKLQRGLLRGNPAWRRFRISEPALGGHGGWRVRRPSCPVIKQLWRRRLRRAVSGQSQISASVEMPQRADAATMDAWNVLADQVAAVLRGAGLPVIRCGDDIGVPVSSGSGAVVEVDSLADSAGGVFVFWQVPDELALPSHAALLAGRLDDPAITHSGRTMSVMIDAVTRLLAENNFAVGDAAHVNDLRALIHVRPGGL